MPLYLEPTLYRRRVSGEGLRSFTVKVRETNIWMAVNEEAWTDELQAIALRLVDKYRSQIEDYIREDPGFRGALEPYWVPRSAPEIVREMSFAAEKASVGPMAAVAGAIAEMVGKDIMNGRIDESMLAECGPYGVHSDVMSRLPREILVENGGDLYIVCDRVRNVAIYAGGSPLSMRVGLQLQPGDTPLGICTSSGKVGHSLSFGNADAAVVLSPSAALADACATALGNALKRPEDMQRALEDIGRVKGVTGAVAIMGELLGVWGRVTLVTFQGDAGGGYGAQYD